MIVYRMAIAAYQRDLSGEGSKVYGGRWNSPGFAAIYTAENISLSVLEILVAADKYNIPPDYYLLKLDIPDDLQIKKITASKLKDRWNDDAGYTQFIGSNFLNSGKEPILKVPSVIVREENNYLLNPAHPDFKRIKITSADPFELDIRLFKNNE
jgi:RES domain-containing protein